jgi:FixJ family two-component response regulator/nitrogen-specific signal transduction histidine kinase
MSQAQPTLLLVDDEEGIRKVLGIVLADLGYKVIAAENGLHAMELFRQHAPPIVITDIKMPVMDGIELLKTIKTEQPETEVIVLTGHGDMDVAIQCLKLEATDFVTKPINDDVLDIALKRANERIRLRRQLRVYTENLERLVAEKSAKLVELERRAAVGQALDGLAAAMRHIAGDLDPGLDCFNDLPCLVSLHSPQLEIVAANQRFTARLGDRLGQSSRTLYTTATQDLPLSPAEQTFKTGQGQRTTARIRLLDGTETAVIVHTAPIRNAAGDVELVLEIAADLSEVRRLQEELRATQQRYEQLFNAAPCYISVQDRQMHITAANQRFRDDFGEIGRDCCYEIYQQREQPCPECPVRKTFEDGLPHQCEMDVTAPGGLKHRMLIWTAPLPDSSGTITHVMEMSTDITDLRRMQDQLSSLGLMIGSVSHAIKGLLTGLDGGMYLLDSGFNKSDLNQVREGWEIVRLLIGRIRRLVLDILYYAKEKELKWERVAALDFAQDVAGLIAPKTSRHNVELVCTFSDRLKDMEVDAGIVHATLTNILENALEACITDHSGGKQHRIEFKVFPGRQHIVFEVADNGIGMDAETQSKIFTPFFISRKKEGSGLGLFMASQILQRNHGQISLFSEPDRGTRVTIRIPRRPAVEPVKYVPAGS